MCITCHAQIPNSVVYADLKGSLDKAPLNFEIFNSTSISHIVMAAIGINGEACQTVAKKLLAKYRDWAIQSRAFDRPWFQGNKIDTVFRFAPNPQRFSAMCDVIIATDDPKYLTEEFRKEFLDGTSTDKIVAVIENNLVNDPANSVPIISNDALFYVGFAVGVFTFAVLWW